VTLFDFGVLLHARFEMRLANQNPSFNSFQAIAPLTAHENGVIF
jgi:hypothetical protein